MKTSIYIYIAKRFSSPRKEGTPWMVMAKENNLLVYYIYIYNSSIILIDLGFHNGNYIMIAIIKFSSNAIHCFTNDMK